MIETVGNYPCSCCGVVGPHTFTNEYEDRDSLFDTRTCNGCGAFFLVLTGVVRCPDTIPKISIASGTDPKT